MRLIASPGLVSGASRKYTVKRFPLISRTLPGPHSGRAGWITRRPGLYSEADTSSHYGSAWLGTQRAVRRRSDLPAPSHHEDGSTSLGRPQGAQAGLVT